MHLVPHASRPGAADTLDLAGVPLSVIFAEGAVIDAIARLGGGVLPLVPPFHVSDEDTYLVLPDDIGMEIVDIFADNDVELLHEALRDGLIVIGGMQRGDDGAMSLHVEVASRPLPSLSRMTPAATVLIDGDAIDAANALDHVQCTLSSDFVDAEGLEQMLAGPEHLGCIWRVPKGRKAELAGVDPTYGWSRRLDDAQVLVELALFVEYEELVVLLRPIVFSPV